MHRRTVHRRIAALALVTALALVGPRPATAAGLGFLDHLDSLWSAVTGAPEGLWETLTGWFGCSESEKTASPEGVMKSESSGTFDPNGNPVVYSAQTVDDSH
jgi:hypothetical protein